MFDVAPTELLAVAVVALLVIGPKDLPKALRVLGYWVGRARGVARQFRSGFDNMVREAEMAEMEKKWASENARIMSEHGAGTVAALDEPATTQGTTVGDAVSPEPNGVVTDDAVVSVEKPVIRPGDAHAGADAKANS